MKAKTLMGMIACAGACVSLSAFGNTTNGWFGVTVGQGITPVNCATNGVAVTVENNKIKLDNDKLSPLTITPDASFTATNMNDGVYVIKATAALTPCSASDLTGNVTDGAKAGFAVGVNGNATNYYGYTSKGWAPYEGVTVVDEGHDTTFKIVLNYRDGKVEFYAGENAARKLGEVTGVSFDTSAPIGIDAFGSGSISSITSGYEVAVAAYNNIKYGSVAEAKAAATAAGGSAANVQGISSSGKIKDPGTKAANGMDYVVCEALGLDVTATDANIAVAPAATDTAENAITLQLTTQTDGTEANLVGYDVYLGNNKKGVTFDADHIEIPLEAGTYTIKPVLK